MGRKEQAASSRALLVTCARECFVELGYANTTVAEILRRADMARGALYHYFPDGKQALFAEVVETVDAPYHAELFELLKLASAVDRLRGGLTTFLRRCAQPDYARIVVLDAESVGQRDWRCGDEFEMIRKELRSGLRSGEFRTVSVDLTAAALFGATRRAGEFVASSDSPTAVVGEAVDSINALIDGIVALPAL
jgi:AcrR family transcriptional regulator